MKILLLIRSLNVGGAERQLLLLARELSARGHAVTVATFYSENVLAQMGAYAGIEVVHLNKRGRWDVIRFCAALWRLIRDRSPAVVYSFLTVANILALGARFAANRPKIVWGVRASSMNAREYDWFVALTLDIERRLARFADLIIFNSRSAMTEAVAAGYPEERSRVIQNGIDTRAFFWDQAAGHRMRQRWHLESAGKLVGIVARLDPMKGHQVFLRAVASVIAGLPDVRFVCVGDGDPTYRGKLQELARSLGIDGRVYWAARETDLNGVYGALDVLCLASVFGEGFPNVVGEAMACELPCVVTAVGDSREIVDSLGWVVPPQDPPTLAAAIVAAVQASRSSKRRDRIVANYSVAALVTRTEAELRALVGATRQDAPAS